MPFASAARAEAGPLINATVISSTGTTTDAVSLADLLQNPTQCPQFDPGATYYELATTGTEPVPLPGGIPGPETGNWTLETALTCLGQIDATAIKAITVYESNGVPEDGPNSILYPNRDLSVPSDFANSSQVPTVGYGSPNVLYQRPERNPNDLDYLDLVQTQGSLQVDIYEIPPLQVTITPPASITPGEPSSFTATVIDPSSPGQTPPGLQYTWNFEDGLNPSGQPTPTVTYPNAGTYTVDLHVTDAAGDGGGTTTNVTIAGTNPITTTTSAKSPATGPSNSAGETLGGGAGKPTKSTGSGKSTATKGPGHHRPKATPKAKPKPKKPKATVMTPKHSIVVTHKRTATTTTTVPSKAPTQTTARTSLVPPPPPPKPASPASRPTVKKRRSADGSPDGRANGTRVSGLVIGAITPATPAMIAKLEAVAAGSRATAPASRPPRSASKLGAVAAIAGVILLLMLGAGRELARRTRLV
jgi:PKD domain